MTRPPLRSLLWRRLASPGAEYFALAEDGEGFRLAGTVVASVEGAPLVLTYEIACDPQWRTRQVHVQLVSGERTESLRLEADGRGGWRRNGEPFLAIEGCLDVDIAATPSTNMLPIRRLGLLPGRAADVKAAWVQVPTLDVETLEQRYTRLGEHEYRYESGGGAFTAALAVDDVGLVTRYAGGWERA